MATTTRALIIILFVNLALVIANMSAYNLNPDMEGNVIECQKSVFGSYGECGRGNYSTNTTNYEDYLPTGEKVVDPSGTSTGTDLWLTIKNWVIDTVPGARLISNIINSPTYVLIAIGIPSTYASLLGIVWWLISAIIVVNWVRGITE